MSAKEVSPQFRRAAGGHGLSVKLPGTMDFIKKMNIVHVLKN